ncbi:hypothetical protein [Halorhodospira halophila]|uniref:Lipoprotein n=1 Tax=Halorhodospira halophila (strain DSM 244 / SL1) TaxID=349124 RepID=A1WY93_HALHL|nr:hypothetical protein [Halorhodospira halophila]ABM62655.1 hypothetical protein Hhal_1891 [Halorhodospira halophila SL1]MBK1728335.1 hypothetical protein [Halorhodospira halophila]
MWYFPKFSALALVASGALVLSACDDASDGDSGGGSNVQLSGTVVDGYVAGARVWVDLQDNGQINSWDPVARTDRYGFFSYRPELDINGDTIPARDYCDPYGDHYNERYCLRVSDAHEGGTLRMVGGYDVLTGEPFEGSMSYRLDSIHEIRNPADLVVNPLTSVANRKGDPVGDFGVDFWGDADGSNGWAWESAKDADKKALFEALALHKTVDVLAAGLDGWLDEQGVDRERVEDALGLDLSMELYRLIREKLGKPDLDGSDPGGVDFSLDKSAIEDILGGFKESISSIDDNFGTDGFSSDDVAEINEALRGLKPPPSGSAIGGASENDVKSKARAGEVAAAVAREDARSSDSPSEVSATGSGSSKNGDYQKILDGLSRAGVGEQVDIRQLSDSIRGKRDNGGLDDSEDGWAELITQSTVKAVLPEISKTKLALEVTGGDAGEDTGRIRFFFEPASDFPSDDYADPGFYKGDEHKGYSDEGALTVCLDGTFESFDLDLDSEQEEEIKGGGGEAGEDSVALRMTGTWERASDRALLLNVNFAGVEETMHLRVRSSSNDYTLSQFYNETFWKKTDDDREWSGSPKFNDSEELKRSEFWSKLSDRYWDEDSWHEGEWRGENGNGSLDSGDWRDVFLGEEFELDDEDRFNFAHDKEENGSGWERSNAADFDGLTPRGWVFDLSYEGDTESWDVEQTRDEALAALEEESNEDADDFEILVFEAFDGEAPDSHGACGESR